MTGVDEALDAVYAAARADREAHQARIVGEMDALAAHLTETLLPPELRAAGLRIAYDTEDVQPLISKPIPPNAISAGTIPADAIRTGDFYADPRSARMTYDDVEDRMDTEYQNRKRQAADLDYIRRYYALGRLGIRVAIGGRVRSHGQEGAIVDTSGHYLMIQFDGQEQPTRRHVTSNMEYATARGWVPATPVADPYAGVQQEA
ncbi:hypothetical protein ACFW5V_31935 [Streptomyces sp. NPDC058762]|uniref:hypothetical protein n=1 Tax=Streptomyces sp. NPDC058762 TaxID=3346629 RepID=UPI0036A031AA